MDPDHFFFSEVPATHRRRNLTTSERTEQRSIDNRQPTRPRTKQQKYNCN